MSPLNKYLDKLRCPDCHGSFDLSEYSARKLPGSLFGILKCDCFEYPVLDSVPVLLKGKVAQFSFGTGDIESEGPSIDEIVNLIRKGEGRRALVECLTFTPTLDFLDRLPVWRLWHKGLVPRITRAWMRNRIDRLVGLPNVTAEDWLQLYFHHHEKTNRVLLDYYRNRFVLPRTLATYALLELLPPDDTILDIACGLGPFPHFLSQREGRSTVIGFDFNFYLVWWQRRFVAPDQLFLCADGARKLPFTDNAFGSVYCSDSFMYISQKEQLLAECARCAPGAPMVMARVGNGDAYPKNWGAESSAAENLKLFGEGTLVFRESDLVRYYLHAINPLQRNPGAVEELRYDKWLYYVSNIRDSMYRYTPSGPRPHLVGHAALNPMFYRTQEPDGAILFSFDFPPSVRFAYQNGDMYSYHGDKTLCDAHVLAHLGGPATHSALAGLAEKFVVIGMPPDYLRPV